MKWSLEHIIVPTVIQSCSEAVVKYQIFIQCSRLIAPLRGYMNRHYEEPEGPFQTMEGRSPIGYYAAYSMWLLTRSHNMINHGLRALVGGGPVGMTMSQCYIPYNLCAISRAKCDAFSPRLTYEDVFPLSSARWLHSATMATKLWSKSNNLCYEIDRKL